MKIITILLTFFLTQVTFSQSEYKISAEGFTFDKPVGSTVKLTVFLSAVNIGSVEEFNGQLRYIRLISKRDASRNYTIQSYTKIVDNDESITGYHVFSLSFLVPTDAADLSIVLPEVYGNLTIPITNETYDRWLVKGNSDKAGKSKNIYPTFTKYVGFGLGFEGGFLSNSSTDAQSVIVGSLGLDILPKILKTGKDKQSVLFADLSLIWGGFLSKGNANGINGLYHPDTSLYQVKDGDSSAVNFTCVGAGLGYFFNLGSVNPVVTASAIYTTIIPIRIKAGSKSVSASSLGELGSYSAFGFKLEAGLHIGEYFLISYSFKSFKINESYDFLKKNHQMHTLKISIWGWDK